MAKFHGNVGFVLGKFESKPGVWVDEIEERAYFGDVVRNTRGLSQGEYLHKDISTTNMLSIVADSYASAKPFAIRYVEWAGKLWTVAEVEVQRPRLLLRLGEVYNGPKAPAPDAL